jgi:hypothetical protein
MSEFTNRLSITRLDGDAAQDQRKIAELQEALRQLEHRLEKQSLVVRALFALLSEKCGLTQEELLDHVLKVEQQKTGSPPRTCGKCRQVMGPRQTRCIYCGEERQVESAFELL